MVFPLETEAEISHPEKAIEQRKYRDVDWTIPKKPLSLDAIVAVLMDIRRELKEHHHRQVLTAMRQWDMLRNDMHGIQSQLGQQTAALNKIVRNTALTAPNVRALKLKRPKNAPPDSTPITDLDVSNRVYHCLRNADLKTVGDIRKRTAREMLREANFGKISLADLEAAIGELERD